MLSPGRWLALLVVGIAVAAAVGNLYFQYASTHRAQEFWGTDTALLVARASRSELFTLGPAMPSPGGVDVATVGTVHREITARRNMAAARGFVHLRHALRQTASYDWSTETTTVLPAETWTHALWLGGDEKSTLLLLHPDAGLVARADLSRAIRLHDTTAAGVRTFLAELAAEEKRETEPEKKPAPGREYPSPKKPAGEEPAKNP